MNDRQNAGGEEVKLSPGKVVLASNNAGKLREFAALLSAAGIELIAQSALNVPEAEEPHPTFVENALAKARHAAKLTGLAALADDSGLCVRALHGAPGVYSARYAQLAGGEKSDAANNARIVEQLKDSTDRRAYYYCVLALVRHADDPEPLIAEGRCKVKSSTCRAARTASATTRISSCPR